MSNKRILFFAAILFAAFSVPARAGVEIRDGSIAVYNGGLVRVGETRALDLPRGVGVIRVTPLPGTVDPASFRLEAPGLRVLSQTLSRASMTEAGLLARYLGREVTVILPDPADAQGRVTRTAVLLAADPAGPIFQVDGKVYLGKPLAVILPGVPEGMGIDPAMDVAVENSGKTRRNVDLSYDLQGLSWSAEYVLTLDPGAGPATLLGRAVLDNGTDVAFAGTGVTLVAGEVRRAPARMLLAKATVAMDALAEPEAVSGREFAEYRVYPLPRPLDIPAGARVMVPLFDAARVAVDRELRGEFRADAAVSGTVNESLDFAVILKNTKKNGLGLPLPAGTVRAEMAGPGGALLPVGETRISHLPENGEARLVLGRPFDLTAERVQTAYRKTGKNTVEVEWRITLTNGSDRAREVLLRETFSGQWTILSADREYRKADARSAEFRIIVPPATKGGKTALTYGARIAR